MTQAWLVTAGKGGELWDVNLSNGIAAISFPEVADLTTAQEKKDVVRVVDVSYPAKTAKRRASWVVQLYRAGARRTSDAQKDDVLAGAQLSTRRPRTRTGVAPSGKHGAGRSHG